MNTTAQSFGRRLRAQRERLGISLDAIAASTKIGRSLLADLEAGDASKWPPGIYRRAFVRGYAEIVGLAPEAVLEEFLELFPDKTAAPHPPAAESDAAFRLTLAEDRAEALVGAAGRLLVAVLELGGVLVLGSLIAFLTGTGFWMASGAVALTYYPLAAACTSRVLAFRWRALETLFAIPSRHAAVPTAVDLVRMVLRQTPVRRADERTI